MSNYTVQLRQLVESGFNLGLAAVDYPIFDESYRATLNAKIIAHYRFREIGAETPGQFKHYLNTTMNEIMPYYNQLYASAALVVNPLYNFNLTETSSRETAAASESSSDAASTQAQEGRVVNADMPASLIAAPNLDANFYASQATRNDGTNTATDHNTQIANNSGLEAFVRNVSGYSGQNPSEALIAFRKTLLNIDMMIINDLAPCFLGVFPL